METILNDYLNNILPKNTLIIHYHIGNTLVGETNMTLYGDGTYKLWSTVTNDRQKLNFTGTLNPFEVNTIIRMIIETKIWTIKPKHPIPYPDDAEAYITITANKKEITIRLLISQIKTEPAFAKIQEAILNLVQKLSDREILETGN